MAGKKIIESQDTTPVQPSDISGEFDTVYVPETPEIEIIPGATRGVKGKGGLDPYAQELIFNEEIVEVMVHESTDENAENPIFTSCQGVPQYFYRGVPQRVKRKYVEILAAVKEHALSTPEYTAQDGSRAVGIRRTSSIKYPFSVISDPNPRGAAWLKALLRAPT
jgi:hypothetical protein